MTATRNVLVLGSIAPEGVARLQDEGLRVDVRPEADQADPAACAAATRWWSRRALRSRRACSPRGAPSAWSAAPAWTPRRSMSRRPRGAASSWCTRPTARSSQRPSTRWRSCWRSPATWPARTPRCGAATPPAAGRRRRGPRQDARAGGRAPELEPARGAGARARHGGARVRAGLRRRHRRRTQVHPARAGPAARRRARRADPTGGGHAVRRRRTGAAQGRRPAGQPVLATRRGPRSFGEGARRRPPGRRRRGCRGR